jgi:putative ABC transport system substrate-binding protein
MRRREFITLLGGAVAAWPLGAHAQQPAMPVIGYLSARAPETDVPMLAAFRRGLSETGYAEGKNVTIEYRWGRGQYDRLPALAEDLARRQVAVIVTGGGENVALAAKAATAKIPIVANLAEDPVRFGLVASLNRPGGNITGVTSLLGAQGAKQLGLLRELVPQAAVIGMLVDSNMPWAESLTTNTQAAARGRTAARRPRGQHRARHRRGPCDVRPTTGQRAPYHRQSILLHPGGLPHHVGGSPCAACGLLAARDC